MTTTRMTAAGDTEVVPALGNYVGQLARVTRDLDRCAADSIDDLEPCDAAELMEVIRLARRDLATVEHDLMRHIGRSGTKTVRVGAQAFRVVPTFRDRWDTAEVIRYAHLDTVEKLRAVFNLPAPRKTVLKDMLDPNDFRELVAEACVSEQTGWALKETAARPGEAGGSDAA